MVDLAEKTKWPNQIHRETAMTTVFPLFISLSPETKTMYVKCTCCREYKGETNLSVTIRFLRIIRNYNLAETLKSAETNHV